MGTRPDIEAILDEIEGILPPKPKAVVVEDQVVRDAEPHVSRTDPNYPNSDEGRVRVRRPDYVTINMPLAIRQWEANIAAKQRDRERMREIDPFGWGHWNDEDDD